MEDNRHAAQTLETLARQFRRFSEREVHSSSDLYVTLCNIIADDPDILSLALNVRRGQLAPNMLLGAIHYLLLSKHPDHPLGGFYPTISARPNQCQRVQNSFRSFCTEYAQELREIVSDRTVQTNEVNRCTCFLPALFLIASSSLHQPFHFVDVGASAGLNLIWDQYLYTYRIGSEVICIGNEGSPVKLQCTIRGEAHPPLDRDFPKVASRSGIEFRPPDLHHLDDVLWLKALIWPDQLERHRAFDRAVDLARGQTLTTFPGDAKELLPEVLAHLPNHLPVCLLFSYSINQIFEGGREQLGMLVAQFGDDRPIHEVSMGYFGNDTPSLIWATYFRGSKTERALAFCDTNGTWLQWLPA
jgi:hypothetical protein